MTLFDRCAALPVWSGSCIASVRLTHWLSSYGLSLLAVMFLVMLAVLPFVAFVDAAFTQFDDGSSLTLDTDLFSDCKPSSSSSQFFGYRLGILYNYGCRVASQVMQ
jgi:hypothetical protein